jgi:hypothetical protein
VVPVKVTDPVSVPTAGETTFTAATNDTDCPVADGLDDDVTDVFVQPEVTAWLRVPVLGR